MHATKVGRVGVCVVGLGLAAWVGAAARAESWCAMPLWVHEWGVQVFRDEGAERVVDGALPGWFHTAGPVGSATGTPVRNMPMDNGIRLLPVMQFYAPAGSTAVPVGLEIGFAQGEASAWFPQVDVRRTGAAANGPEAAAARAQLVMARAARPKWGLSPTTAALPPDPTRQLEWDSLLLQPAPAHPPVATDGHTPGWIDALRANDPALWVNGARESDRFVFYEGKTRETAALRLEPAPASADGKRRVVIHNVTDADVFDAFLVVREDVNAFIFHAPVVAAGQSVTAVVAPKAAGATFDAEAQAALRATLVDADAPAAPTDYRWDRHDCVEGRDPAVPVEASQGYRLFAPEVDALLRVWGPRLFTTPGATLVYREDTRYLDQVMPLSVYTDMFHFVQIRRASLGIVQRPALP